MQVLTFDEIDAVSGGDLATTVYNVGAGIVMVGGGISSIGAGTANPVVVVAGGFVAAAGAGIMIGAWLYG